MKPPSTPSQLEVYQAEAHWPELATSEMGPACVKTPLNDMIPR
jgi:hypothetical protein